MWELLAVGYVIWRPFMLGSLSLGCFALAGRTQPPKLLRVIFALTGALVLAWAAFPYLAARFP